MAHVREHLTHKVFVALIGLFAIFTVVAALSALQGGSSESTTLPQNEQQALFQVLGKLAESYPGYYASREDVVAFNWNGNNEEGDIVVILRDKENHDLAMKKHFEFGPRISWIQEVDY